MNEKFAPHLEELTRALGNTDPADIRAELEKLLAFRVPVEEAKQILLRKFRGKPSGLKLKVNALSANLKNFEITGRILDMGEKVLHSEKASVLYTGVLADETGSIAFSSWKKLPFPAGTVININGAYTRLWQNRVRLSIGENAAVSKQSDSVLPSLEELSKSPVRKLCDINSVDLSVSSIAAVLEFSHKEVPVKGKTATIISGVLADETARLPFTSWVDLPGVDIGSILRFEDATVRVFRGVPSINFNTKTRLSVLQSAEDLAFTYNSLKGDPKILKMEIIVSREGMFDVATAGNVISVRPGSGIISRCPECGRVVQKGNCRVHGRVEGIRDMRVKAVLDDGTGTMAVVFNRELSELIYGKSLLEAEELMYSDISKDAVFEDLRRILTGCYLAVRGNAFRNDYGSSFVAEKVWVPEDDLAVRAVEILQRLEAIPFDERQVPEAGTVKGGEV